MNYRQISQNTYMLDIHQRDCLLNIGNQFDQSNSPTQQEKLSYYNAFISYIDFAINYCQTELKGKTYSEEHIIPQVFINEIKSKQAYKQYWRSSLYCAQLYLLFLKQSIDMNYLGRYQTLRLNLVCDMECLFAQYEICNKGFNSEIQLSCGARNEVSTLDMCSVLNALNRIENIPDIKDISLRDIKPYQMFVIRQLLESLGKKAIGFDAIVDKNNKMVPKFTQVSWEFLNEYSKKCTSWIVFSPISISCIYLLNKWANSFVHGGFIYASYIQYYAVSVINKLMQCPSNPVKCYDGNLHLSTLFGDIRIEKYNMLKHDFEKYINSKSRTKKRLFGFICNHNENKYNVKWKDLDSVGAYIISL